MYYAELDLPRIERIEKKHRNGLMDGNIARIWSFRLECQR